LGPAGYSSSFRAEIIAAMIPSTRLRPSSIAAHYHFRRVFASGMQAMLKKRLSLKPPYGLQRLRQLSAYSFGSVEGPKRHEESAT
jgi:hypothetical protein